MRKLFIWFSLIIAAFASYSQNLYMPRDVQLAFKKGTRSPDGMPGKNYWQNTGRYNITITAMPPDRNIKGTEQITYINNSPETIRNPVIKLLLNIHKPGAARDRTASPDYLTSGVHIDAFTVNGQSTAWRESQYYSTFQSFRLSQPLAPHDSVKLSFDWHYQISLESSREGMIDSTTYFIAYFYPRVAVFDDYNGWDRMEFTDGKEFYNDFNDYVLNVKVPGNYVVWSTGTLQNAAEVLQPQVLAKFNTSLRSDSIIHIATFSDVISKNITIQKPMNTWTWTANNITDVTFGLSDHYVWDASSVVVDNPTHRRASVQAAYNDTAKDFHSMVEFGKHSLDWLSNNYPGVPYPFPKTTIFQGYADMEYPMMVNDGTQQDPIFTRFIAEHEIAHTWFPFYMGINETRYGFMDEGWATALELLIGREDLGVEQAEGFFKQFRVSGWIQDASQEEDVPIITPSNMLNGAGLGNNEYGKPALGYLAVKDLLGDALFKKCLLAFMERWHGRHPIPWDFFNTFTNVSGQNLNWFWNSWFFTNGYIDMALAKTTKTGNSYAITVDNTGGFPAPFDLKVTYTDGTVESMHKTPAIWSNNQKQAVINLVSSKEVSQLQIDGGIFMDADESNNSWKK
ncbi:MAG: M1 family metallopeptidase [Ginsengibacter sp.]